MDGNGVIVDFVTNNRQFALMPKNDDFDLQTFLPYLLNQAAEESSLAFQRVYKEHYGMLRTEWRVLFHLGMYGAMTASEIGARAGIHKTKISRAVQKLAGRRFLTRLRNEADRRSEQLKLTTTGESAFRDLRRVASAYEERLLQGFSDAEVATLKHLLQRLAG